MRYPHQGGMLSDMTYFTATRRGLRIRLGGMFGVAWFIPWRRRR